MDKHLCCKNTKCSFNKGFKNNGQKEECKKFTEQDLKNKKFCEEREW